jgi:serine/threonine protein kinase
MKEPFGAVLSLGELRGRINPDWDTPAMREALRDCRGLLEDRATEILLRGRNTVAAVLLPSSAGTKSPAVLKSFGLHGVNRLKTAVLPSKAAKAWRGAAALVERGLPTAPPIAFLESRRGGFAAESYFLSGRLEGVREVRFLFRELEGEALDRLLSGLASFLAACHERGIVHRDLSDGNILVGPDGRGGQVFYLLDTNRVRVRRRLGPRARVRNLVRLGVPAGRRDYFLDRYSGDRPLPPGLRRWYKFHKAVYWGRIRLKKKLRLKALARKLGLQ